MSFLRDITDRKRAEEEIHKFKIVADQAVHGIAISDMQGQLLYINNYFVRIHGYKLAELIGGNLSAFHNEQQLEDDQRLNKALVDDGKYLNKEVWHGRKNGSVFPMLINGVVIKDESGTAQFLAATALDISERKLAMEALKRARDDYQTITNLTEDIIVQSDKEGRWTFLNEQACEFCGKPREVAAAGLDISACPGA